MVRRHVVAALGAGIVAGDEDVARAALRRIDPIARGLAKKKLERALIDAALACDAAQLSTPSSVHVMRLAALELSGRSPADAADTAAIESAYAALPKRAMPRFPLWTLVSSLALVAMLGSFALYIATRPGPASRTYVRPLPPPSAEAYIHGGVPLTDPTISALLNGQLTDLVVDGGRARDHRDNDLPGKLAGLRSPKALAARGAAVAKAWDSALDVFARSVVIAQRPEGPTRREHDEIRETVRELSAAFIAAGLGYHLEGRFKNGYPYIQAYRVEEVVFVIAGGVPRRVLSLRRLDKLNSSWAALGMHDEDAGDPVLHLDRIDVNVASTVLPVLANTSPFPLGDHEWMLWDQNKALASAIGDAVRKDYATALGRDAASATKIAGLLVKRADIIEEWRDKLGRKSFYFVSTDSLFVPPKLLSELKGVVPNYQRKKVIEIDNELAELSAPRIHSRMHELVSSTVRRHEAQHGFDYDRDTEARYPQALADMLGAPHDAYGDEVGIVRSARHELSAYLSQLINDPLTPQASLWNLGAHAFNRDRWGTGECYAAVVVLEGLGKQFGVTLEGPRFQRGVNRERLVALAKVLASQSDDKLRAAAKALWTELYAEPPPTIVEAAAKSVVAAR